MPALACASSAVGSGPRRPRRVVTCSALSVIGAQPGRCARVHNLVAEQENQRWPKLAARWHSRFVNEVPGIDLDKSGLALNLLRALDSPNAELAAETLRQLARTNVYAAAQTVIDSSVKGAAAPSEGARLRVTAPCDAVGRFRLRPHFWGEEGPLARAVSRRFASFRVGKSFRTLGGEAEMANPVPAGSDVSAGTYRCTKCRYQLEVGSTPHVGQGGRCFGVRLRFGASCAPQERRHSPESGMESLLP